MQDVLMSMFTEGFEEEIWDLKKRLREADDEHERLLAHAREVRGSRDVHSVYEVLDWQRQQIAAKEAEAAGMRKALEPFATLAKYIVGRPEVLAVSIETALWKLTHRDIIAARTALSATAGADLLTRLQAAEEKAHALELQVMDLLGDIVREAEKTLTSNQKK